jgi:transposase-like protein
LSIHFLLSAKARTLSLAKVLRQTDEEAFATFKAIRWAETDGAPVCPRCGVMDIYNLSDNRRFKCAGCLHKFSVTSSTIFASRKMSLRDILGAIAIFVNGAKGHSALQLSRDLDCQYRTAFVLLHKLREAMTSEQEAMLDGEVEVDGAYFGGYVKPANYREHRVDRRLAQHRTGKRRVVIVMRERRGQIITRVGPSESSAVPEILARVAAGSTIHADEANGWDALGAKFATRRINHSECYSDGQACTNMAESFFSRLRRAEKGTHHHIAGRYLHLYAGEMGWREDARRVSNGEQFLAATGAALAHPVSRAWKGYSQRHLAA